MPSGHPGAAGREQGRTKIGRQLWSSASLQSVPLDHSLYPAALGRRRCWRNTPSILLLHQSSALRSRTGRSWSPLIEETEMRNCKCRIDANPFSAFWQSLTYLGQLKFSFPFCTLTLNSWTIQQLVKSPNKTKTPTIDRPIYIAFVIKGFATLFLKCFQPLSMFTYLIVEPATFLQGGQISLCDSQFESGTQDKVWVALSQCATYSCCHFLQNQFTQGLTKYLIFTFAQHSKNGWKCCCHLGKLRHLFLTVLQGCGMCRFSPRWIKRRNFSVHQSEARGYLSRQIHFSQLLLL